jgi:PAS domain S-box-containing protein
MRIKTQLIMSMVILGVSFLIISASVISTNQQVDQMNRQEELANNIVRGAYELSYLSNDYLLHQENRQLMQWRSKFSSFSDDLTQLKPATPEQQTLVDNIRTNQRRLQDVFNQVVSTIESPTDTQSKSAGSEFIQVSWSRIGVQNQGIIFDASRLSQMFHSESDKLRQNNTLLTYASLVIILLVLLFNFVFTSRRILRSLSNLQDGTKIIGSGNLDYAIDESSRDEIGELSHAFNQMTSNLKGVTASKADLEKEIAERKQAEQSSKESLELYQTLAESAKDIIFICDPAGNLHYFNKNGAAVFGTTVDDIIGKNLEQAFPPEIAREQRRQLELVLESKKPLFAEINMPLPKSDFWLDVQLIPIFTEQSTIKSVMGVARDITPRKNFEKTLRMSEERFRIAVESASDLVWEWNLESGTLEWFGNIDSMLGYEPGTFPRTIDAWEKIIHPDDSAHAAASLDRHLKFHEPYSEGYRVIRKDGTVLYWLDKGAVIPEKDGKSLRMVGVISNITRQKVAEESLKKYSERLEEMVSERTRQLMEAQDQLVKKEKLAVLGKLAGGVGHELRNPLGAIKNAAYFLDMALEKPDPDVKEMVGLINKEVVRSEDIISSLLDFARPKVLTLRKGAVNTVVNEALKRNPVPNNVAVISNLDETLPEIQADSDKLLQVFNNIISNAFQAMPEGGSLTIISKKSGPGGVSIAFADTGLGISAENMKKLFEPLFTTKIKGIGLGMVVTKTIVEAHGGHIDVQSEEGKGTTITVNLPMSGRKED